jgi:hypothetical protein
MQQAASLPDIKQKQQYCSNIIRDCPEIGGIRGHMYG